MSKIIESIIQNPGKYKLRKHQVEAMYFAENNMPNLNLYWGVGSGKSAAAISIIRMRYAQEGKRLKTLILGPVVTLGNWKNEWKLFSNYDPNTIHVLNQSSSKKKAEYMRKNLSSNGTDLDIPDIVIVNYDGIITPELCLAIADWKPDIIVGDECHRLKSSKAKRTKVVRIFCREARYKIFLTGTAVLNAALDVFSPFLLLDNGETFGTNEYVFQSKFMVDKNAAWKGRTGYFPKLVTNEKMIPELNRLMFAKSIKKLTSECVDLPAFSQITIAVEASSEQKQHYNNMLKLHMTFIQENKDKPKAVTANLALTKGLRLQQIASGYIQTDDGSIVEFKNNPRLDATEEILEGLLEENEKVILWCSFVQNYRMLEKLLQKMKVKYCLLTGEQKPKEKDESIRAFQEDSDMKVIIANRMAGGIGVNLTAAKYSIVYSRNFSLEEEIQSTGRNYRGGSEHFDKIVKYDLCLKNSIDEKVLEALKNKQNISDLIMDTDSYKEQL